MSVIARLLSSGVARGVAALLALLLSAVIGGRLGVERLSFDLVEDECAPAACPQLADLADHHSVVDGEVAGVGLPEHRSARTQDRCAYTAPVHVPTTRRGAAGGPRAP